jgi:hypothetical protein
MTIINTGLPAHHLRDAFSRGESDGTNGYPSNDGEYSGDAHAAYTRGYSLGGDKRADVERTPEERELAQERLKARREAEDDEG